MNRLDRRVMKKKGKDYIGKTTEGETMARPVDLVTTLEGEAARRFLKDVEEFLNNIEDPPLTPAMKKMIEAAKKIKID